MITGMNYPACKVETVFWIYLPVIKKYILSDTEFILKKTDKLF